MDVLLTGAYGRCGTAILDELGGRDEYRFSYLDRDPRPEAVPRPDGSVRVADVASFDAIRPAFEGQDAVVHLAGYPRTDATWDDVEAANVRGTYNALEAASEAEVGTFVFASTNHVMGMYEVENAPDIYHPGFGLTVDRTDPIRPDSLYGTSKAFGEAACRQYVETRDYPERVYALRICSVRHAAYDHPYGDAERGVDDGRWERDSPEYDEQVARMKAMWHSRRDFAHMVERCLRDEDVSFGIYSGVSANERRWFGIEDAREELGYDPKDDGEEWDGPPGVEPSE